MKRLVPFVAVFAATATAAIAHVTLQVAPLAVAAEPTPPVAPAAPAATAATAVASPAPVPGTGVRTWRIDPAKSSIVIQVFKDGVAARFAHDHVVAARQFAGTVSGDPADPTTARVEVTAQTASFVNDEPALRQQFNLPLEVSDSDRATIDKSMKGDEVLDVARFPTVSFRSTSVDRAADGALTLRGKLTLHGVTRAVSMPLSVKTDGGVIDGRASFRLKTSDYDMPPYSAMLGAVKCKDEIVLHLHLVAG
jgi:polyisoprenoid-binding protein YceI